MDRAELILAALNDLAEILAQGAETKAPSSPPYQVVVYTCQKCGKAEVQTGRGPKPAKPQWSALVTVVKHRDADGHDFWKSITAARDRWAAAMKQPTSRCCVQVVISWSIDKDSRSLHTVDMREWGNPRRGYLVFEDLRHVW